MKGFVSVGLLIASLAGTPAVRAEDLPRVPDHVAVTEGIVGGIVPAHIRRQTLVVAREGGHEVHVLVQPDRTSKPRYRRGQLSQARFRELVEAIEAADLWNLPVERPAGSEDIYRLDTSVAVRLGSKHWRNGGPAGCVRGRSEVDASADERQQFANLVHRIHEVADSTASEPSDAQRYLTALALVRRR